MRLGQTELTREVAEWLLTLSDDDFGHVAYRIDLLHDRGVHLTAPHARRLGPHLRELRLHLGSRAFGITYCHTAMGGAVLLTVLPGGGPTEEAEIRRAASLMQLRVDAGQLVLEREEECLATA
jgi:hypothetical protein